MPVKEATDRWTDWRWQQRSAIRTAAELREILPGLADADVARIDAHSRSMRFQLTPHYVGLIERTADGQAPAQDDPLWRQVLPANPDGPATAAVNYDGTENWEMPEEMVTPIGQRKYDDRVIIRAANVCHAYCQFCYEALRTLEKHSDKTSFNLRDWDATVDYLREHPEIHEVILSGGEPLMQGDAQLARLLSDLRSLDRPIAIRIHTRALTFNPFRVTDALCELLGEYRVNAVGLHVTHVNEIGVDFEDGARRLQRHVPLLFANIPLLRGINDSADAIGDLGMRLYLLGVVRGYLYHFMPHSPGSDVFRTAVRTGVDITRTLKRRMSNLAVPEYVLPHHTGKHTMPLLGRGEQPPSWDVTGDGDEVVRYTNWLGDLVEYPDPPLQATGAGR